MEKILANKHILIDTNVISYIFRYTPEKYGGLFDLFEKIQCTLCINTLINIEFVRIAQCKTEKDIISSFLDDKFFNLPIDNEIYENCKELSTLYNYCSEIKNKRQVSVVDLINAAFLKKYSNDLFLITHDLSDYPLQILDRIDVGAVDLDNEVITWGIYKFNLDKFSSLKAKFDSK